MAVYDINATPATAVTAFLSQFTITAEGNIRYSTGTDTFHVWWLHRALQKIAWDYSVSGDDEINLSKPNPSSSEALGTIITLNDWTTDYSVKYNITATEAEYLFGGSISQDGGDEEWGGLIVLGSTGNVTTQLQIISNGALLTSHWGTGKNQTDANTLLRILVKTKTAGTLVDGGRIIVKANEWGYTFAVWRTTLGVGEKVASITTAADPQNTTLQATVDAYIGISNTEGYQGIDIGDGSGTKNYLSQWVRGVNSKKALYEWVKSLMTRGSAATLYGMDANLFTGGPTFVATVDTGAGTWVQSELVSWTEGTTASTGRLMAADSLTGTSTTKLWIHIITGINPTDGTVLTGAGAATGTINVTVDTLTSSPNHLGQYTGSWIGAEGIGFSVSELTSSDSVDPLDGTAINPPNNVPISVSVNGATDANAHVFLARRTAGAADLTQYTLAAGNNSGNGTLVVAEAISSDEPQTGYVLIKETTYYIPYQYTSWSGSTFTLAGTLAANYTAAKDVGLPFFYEDAVGGSDPRVASKSLIYNVDIPVIGWVRRGDPATPKKPVPITGTIGSAGLALTVQLESE